MKIRLPIKLIPLLLVATIVCGGTVQAVSCVASYSANRLLPPPSTSITSNETSMLLLLRYIVAAEATFQATTGAGRFGTLQELYLARLIDVRVRTGVNEGYRFVLSVSNPPVGVSSFDMVAKPVSYMETGVRTFSINQSGALLESYEKNAPLAEMQLVIDECESVTCTQAFALSALRTIQSAEATFQSTAGAGRYGTLEELAQNNLISSSLSSGHLNGYVFRVQVHEGSGSEPASFDATATPLRFPRTGIISYFIDETGVMRGANKNGLEAEPGDDAICN